MRVKGAAEQRGAFAHPDDAVPATGGLVTGRLASQRRAARGRVGHGDLDSVRLEADGHLGAAPAVAYRVGQRLLQDAVRRPADAAGQPSALAAQVGGEGEAAGAMVIQQLVQCRGIGRYRRLGAAVVAQRPYQLVDLAHRGAGHLLDGGDSPAGALGVAVVQEAGRTGLDENHVDRVAGRVVQLTGDAGALFAARSSSSPMRSRRSRVCAPAIHTPARIRAQNTNPGSVPRSWWPPTVSTATVAAMKAPAASSAAVRRTGRASPLWATATAYKATTGPNGTSTG